MSRRGRNSWAALAVTLCTVLAGLNAPLAQALRPVGAQHVIVYAETDVFAGWPANEGIWSWGNEILVGFDTGAYEYHDDTHSFAPPAITHLARSSDGGITWQFDERALFDETDGSPDGYLRVRNAGIAQLCTVIEESSFDLHPLYHTTDIASPNVMTVRHPTLRNAASDGADLDGGAWFYGVSSTACTTWSLYE